MQVEKKQFRPILMPGPQVQTERTFRFLWRQYSIPSLAGTPFS